MPELESLAATVHGFLAFGHALGVIFNWKRYGWRDRDTLAHAAWLVYDARAAWKHVRRRRHEA